MIGRVREISLECAQPRLDMAVIESLPSKRVHIGVLDLRNLTVETPEVVAERIHRALEHIDIQRVVVAPDCGLKYLPRDAAFGKMKAMVAGAEIVRAELT